jgi:hypothetical protein
MMLENEPVSVLYSSFQSARSLIAADLVAIIGGLPMTAFLYFVFRAFRKGNDGD